MKYSFVVKHINPTEADRLIGLPVLFKVIDYNWANQRLTLTNLFHPGEKIYIHRCEMIIAD
jgi:hypothetical protein